MPEKAVYSDKNEYVGKPISYIGYDFVSRLIQYPTPLQVVIQGLLEIRFSSVSFCLVCLHFSSSFWNMFLPKVPNRCAYGTCSFSLLGFPWNFLGDTFFHKNKIIVCVCLGLACQATLDFHWKINKPYIHVTLVMLQQFFQVYEMQLEGTLVTHTLS